MRVPLSVVQICEKNIERLSGYLLSNPRCRRSLPGGRRGQGHRDVLRYSERRLKAIRLLAGYAFASGGPIGYDHKKMEVTAGGTWRSVKRHFRELVVNTQSTDFTVVGIGDMSGSVTKLQHIQ
jgi:hypothetical protein